MDLVHEPAKLKNPRLSPPVAKSSLMSGFVKTQIKRKKRTRCLILSIVSFIFSWSNCQEAAIHSWGTRIKKVDLGNFEHWGAVESHYHPQLQVAAPIVLLKGYPTTRASTSTSFSSKPHNQYTSQRLSVVKESCLLYHSAKKKKKNINLPDHKHVWVSPQAFCLTIPGGFDASLPSVCPFVSF